MVKYYSHLSWTINVYKITITLVAIFYSTIHFTDFHIKHHLILPLGLKRFEEKKFKRKIEEKKMVISPSIQVVYQWKCRDKYIKVLPNALKQYALKSMRIRNRNKCKAKFVIEIIFKLQLFPLSNGQIRCGTNYLAVKIFPHLIFSFIKHQSPIFTYPKEYLHFPPFHPTNVRHTICSKSNSSGKKAIRKFNTPCFS